MSKIKQSQRLDASMEDYLHDIEAIWFERGKDRHPHMTLLYMLSHASEVCEEIRKGKWDKAVKELGEVLVWWFSFVAAIRRPPTGAEQLDAYRVAPHVDVKPSDIIWSKFPSLCTVCLGRWCVQQELQPTLKDVKLDGRDIPEARPLEEEMEMLLETYYKKEVERSLSKEKLNHLKRELGNSTCRCAGNKAEGETRGRDFKLFAKVARMHVAFHWKDDRPRSLFEMTEMLKKIYANNVEVFSTEEIAFHLLEEVGEVSQAFLDMFTQPMTGNPDSIIAARHVRVTHLAEELADVFSWSVMLHTKLGQEMKTAGGIVTLFADHQGMDGGPVAMFNTSIKPINSIVELLWALYGSDAELKCETCKETPCSPGHERHSRTRSMLPLHLEPRDADLLIAGSKLNLDSQPLQQQDGRLSEGRTSEEPYLELRKK